MKLGSWFELSKLSSYRVSGIYGDNNFLVRSRYNPSITELEPFSKLSLLCMLWMLINCMQYVLIKVVFFLRGC